MTAARQGASAKFTMNRLRFLPDALYGREEELETIINAYKDIAATAETAAGDTDKYDDKGVVTSNRQLILVSGLPGVGKSALVQAALKPTLGENNNNAFYLGGKFDQQQQDEPYKAFTMAFQGLCEHLLLPQNQNLRQEIRLKLVQELPRDIQGVLLSVFPDLVHILTDHVLQKEELEEEVPMICAGGGEEDGSTSTTANAVAAAVPATTATTQDQSYMDSWNRFSHAFRQLMQVINTFGPVVLFLDDLQWADTASLELFKSLLTQSSPTTSSRNSNSNSNSSSSSFQKKTPEETDDQESRPSANKKNCGLLVVGNFRSDHIHQHHPLSAVLQELQVSDCGLQMKTMELGNLTVNQVNQMLVDLLSATPEETLSLAECVHRKTLGNSLYVIQFLELIANMEQQQQQPLEQQEQPSQQSTPNKHKKNLNNKALLSFNLSTFQWSWDVEEIQVQMSSTTNVLQMIQRKLETLPPQMRTLLPVVALLGASSQYSLVERVLRHFHKQQQQQQQKQQKTNTTVEQREQALAPTQHEKEEENVEQEPPFDPAVFIQLCEEEGLLLFDRKRNTVQWEHDKIQEAALSAGNEQELAVLKTQVGQFLKDALDAKELESNIFAVVNLLDNDAYSSFPDASGDCTQHAKLIVDLNWMAGKKALRSAAFESAAAYLARGIEALPEDGCHWETQYSQSLDMYSSAAEAHLCIGKVEETQRYCEAVYSRADIPILDKERVYTVLIRSIQNCQNNSLLAQEKCLEVLALIDCKFPKYGRSLYTMGTLIKTAMSIDTLEKKIARLPKVTDQKKRWAIELLDILSVLAYQNASDLYSMIIFRGFEYTLKYGIGSSSPPILSSVGVVIAAGWGDIEGCWKFGNMALALYDESSTVAISNRAKSRTVMVTAAYCLHWKRTVQKIQKNFLDGYQCGLFTGDVGNAVWSIFCYLEAGFHSGVPLHLLEKDCQMYVQQMKELKQTKVSLYTQTILQLVLNLLGHTEDPSELDGTAIQLSEVLRDADVGVKAQINRIRIATAFWSGDYAKTVDIIEETGAHLGTLDKAFLGFFVQPPLHCQCAVALLAVYQKTKKQKYKNMSQYHNKMIKGWAEKGDPNVTHSLALIEAEKSSLKKNGKFNDTVGHYKDSIKLAGRQGIRHDQALGHERLAEFYLRHGWRCDAEYHFQRAMNLYEEWGSARRAKEVRERIDAAVGELSSIRPF